MYFVIVAKDAPSAETQERRLPARPDHMDGLRRLRIEGRMIDGGPSWTKQGAWQDIPVYPIRRVDWDALVRSAPAS